MTKTLYLKYRPQTLDELDLKNVRESLTKIINSGDIPHAMLFSGPRGSGKTSAARILAKVVNCEKGGAEPCNKCEQCISIMNGSNMDVIEIDAASHRGIDDIRSLRENIALTPTAARKKVYIIDEVHMLTREAFNAFLKTLEEPPEHVTFILATTNPEKIPETVASRLTNIVFGKANSEEIKRQLDRVMKGEKIKAEDGVTQLITKASDGSFRDAVKILSQLSIDKNKLTKSGVEEALFQSSLLAVERLIGSLVAKDAREAMEIIEKAISEGASVTTYTESILGRLHRALLSKVGLGDEDIEGLDKDELLNLIEIFLEAQKRLSYSPIEHLPLLIAILKSCGDVSFERLGASQTQQVTASQTQRKKKVIKKVEVKSPVKLGNSTSVDEEIWKKALSSIGSINTTVEALLRSTKPIGFDGKNLKLGVYYKFHKEQLEVQRNRLIIENAFRETFGRPIIISCTLTEKPNGSKKGFDNSSVHLTESNEIDILKAAEEVFGN